MGNIKGFLKAERKAVEYRPVCERVNDFREVALLRSATESQQQASRCMDCGTPFCHFACPIGNYIPEWNDFMFRANWEKAFTLLQATNNFPEITGRVCPALCEYSCVLEINDEPVTVRENELAIIEYAFLQGWVRPNAPKFRTGKKVAVIGSGPAGLSCAEQLNKAGHNVVVFEKDDKIGGILRYGIPDFKMEKWVLDRRLKLLEQEGIKFATQIEIGKDLPMAKLKKEFEAICLTGGSRVPRDLKIEGRNLSGIHFAMAYLTQANKKVAGEKIKDDMLIDAKDKKVVVIGGGDTGADCVGVAHRQQARAVVQIEVLPAPPECRTDDYSWPCYPLLFKKATSHEEGGERQWAVITKKFIGENAWVKKLRCQRVEFVREKNNACPVMKEIPGSDFEIEADLVVLAIGFIHPEHNGLLQEARVVLDERGNVKTDNNFMTNVKGVFSAGDMRRGQSLIIWAISEGKRAARAMDVYLMGSSPLPK